MTALAECPRQQQGLGEMTLTAAEFRCEESARHGGWASRGSTFVREGRASAGGMVGLSEYFTLLGCEGPNCQNKPFKVM
jgi:hypothetical protein